MTVWHCAAALDGFESGEKSVRAVVESSSAFPPDGCAGAEDANAAEAEWWCDAAPKYERMSLRCGEVPRLWALLLVLLAMRDSVRPPVLGVGGGDYACMSIFGHACVVEHQRRRMQHENKEVVVQCIASERELGRQ